MLFRCDDDPLPATPDLCVQGEWVEVPAFGAIPDLTVDDGATIAVAVLALLVTAWVFKQLRRVS